MKCCYGCGEILTQKLCYPAKGDVVKFYCGECAYDHRSELDDITQEFVRREYLLKQRWHTKGLLPRDAAMQTCRKILGGKI